MLVFLGVNYADYCLSAMVERLQFLLILTVFWKDLGKCKVLRENKISIRC